MSYVSLKGALKSAHIFVITMIAFTSFSCSLKVVHRLTGTSILDSSTNPIPQLDYGSNTYRFAPNFAISLTPLTLDAGVAATITSCVLDSSSPALPVGITLDATTCVVSGTAIANSSPTLYTIIASNSVGNDVTDTVTIEFSDAIPTLTYSPSSYFTALTITPDFSFTINPSVLDAGNGRTFDHCAVNASTPFPAEYTLNPADCSISGAGTAAMATDTYQVEIYNDLGDFSIGSITIGVYDRPVLTMDATIQVLDVGSAFSMSPTAFSKDSRLTITNCVDQGGALPPSLTVDPATCVISGTPLLAEAQSGTYQNTSTTIRVTDSYGTMVDATVNFDLREIPALSTFDVTNQLATTDPTNDPNVNLSYTLSAGTADEFCVLEGVGSLISSCSWVGVFPATFTLASGDGSVLMNLWVRDSFGRTSPQYTSSIVLDRAEDAPTSITLQGITSPNDQVTFDVRVGATNVGQTVTLYEDAGCSSQIGTAPGTAVTTDVSVTIGGVDGTTYDIYGTITDSVGNVSVCSTVYASYQFLLNTVPVITSFDVLNQGMTTDPTNDPNFNLQYVLGSGSADEFCVVEGAATSISTCVWDVSFPTTTSTAAADATISYSLWVRDTYGRTSARSVSSIVLDRAEGAPTSITLQGITSPNDQTTFTVRVGATAVGQTITLYEDAGCSSQVGTDTGAAGTTDVSVSIAGVDGTTYDIYGTITDSIGNVSPCSTVYASYLFLNYPAAPLNVLASAGTANVTISWDAVTGADTYTVYRSTTSGSGFSALAACTTQAGVSCTDLTALNGTIYYYVVRATNARGDSPDSLEVSAQPIGSFTITSVVVNNTVGPDALEVTWTDPAAGVDYYDISWGTGGSPTGAGSASNVSYPYLVSGLVSGTEYTFMVTAKNSTGGSVDAASSMNGTPMTLPVIGTVNPNGSGAMDVAWTDGVGATAFTVKYGSTSGTYGSTFSTSATSPTTITGLAGSTVYYVMVTATNASGSLDAAAEGSGTSGAGAPMMFVVQIDPNDPDTGGFMGLPLRSGYNYNFTVDWGDGSPLATVTSDGDPNASHNYSVGGNFTITLTGLAEAWYFEQSNPYISDNVVQVIDLGDMGWKNLEGAFSGCYWMTSFAGGVTANVTNMSKMFYGVGAASFDFSTFNTSSVTNMSEMFHYSAVTSLDLSSFNTSNVTNMSEMFRDARGLTSLNITGWDVSSVTTMAHMFYDVRALTSLSMAGFTATSLTNITQMFVNMYALTSLNLSNVSMPAIASMSSMFAGLTNLTTLNLSGFAAASVTNMSQLFYNLSSLTSLDLTGFSTTNVTNMSQMFYGVSALASLDLSTFNTANVTNMSQMFRGMIGLTSINLSSLNTASVTNMSQMFYDVRTMTTLTFPNIDTTNVTNMSDMFRNMYALTSLDLSNLSVASVTDMSRMFYEVRALTTLDLSNFGASPVTSITQMFYHTNALTTLNLSGFNPTNLTSASQMFSDMPSITSIDLSNFTAPSLTNVNQMFKNLTTLTSLNVSNFTAVSLTSMGAMFYYLTALTNLNLTDFNTVNVTDMSGMFNHLTSLTTLDLSDFNTSNVTLMNSMFYYLTNLTSINLSSFNTENVTNMSQMFRDAVAMPTLDLSNFDTSSVTDMNGMFYNMRALTSLNVSSFDTSNVTNMASMFYYVETLTSLNLSNFNTSNVTNMASMFRYMFDLTTLNVSSFNTANVTNMAYMFGHMWSMTTYDLSHFNTSKVTDMTGLFYNAATLFSIWVKDWDLTLASGSTNVFFMTLPGMIVWCNQGGAPGTGSFFGKACSGY